MRLVGPALLLAPLLVSCAESGPHHPPTLPSDPAVRSNMAANMTALQTVLPLALSEARFADPSQQATIRQALQTLAENGDSLEAHSGSRGASFRYLSRSFAADSRAALQRFDEQRLPASRFLLGRIVEDCTACHSRLPSPDSKLGGQLFDAIDSSELDADERVRLEIATRQFLTALDTYEAIFADPSQSPARLDLEGVLTDYLVVTIRVENDLARASRGLAKLAERSDTPLYLRRHIETWRATLDELERHPDPRPPLDRARSLLEAASRQGVFPADRSVLIHDLMASALLHRFANSHPEEDQDLAEAHYLLGVAETRVRRSWWLSEAEFYLETSIRMAPDAPFAPRAYALYEEQILAGYGGSGGTQLPADVLARLAELRSMIRQP